MVEVAEEVRCLVVGQQEGHVVEHHGAALVDRHLAVVGVPLSVPQAWLLSRLSHTLARAMNMYVSVLSVFVYI